MVKGTPTERFAKRRDHFLSLAKSGALHPDIANLRIRESKISILGASSVSGDGPPKKIGGQNQRQVKAPNRRNNRSGEVVLPSPESRAGPFDFPAPKPDGGSEQMVDCEFLWDKGMWEPASHFNNVALASVIVRFRAPLDVDSHNMRVAIAFSGTKPTSKTTYEQVSLLKGALVLRGEKIEGTHSLSPPAGAPRAIRRQGKEVKVEGNVEGLYMVWAMERKDGYAGKVTIHYTVRYNAGGGAFVPSTTSL